MRATIIGCTISHCHTYRHLPSTFDTHDAACSRPTNMRRCVHFLPPGPSWPPTPLRELPALARDLGIGRLFAKDEIGRFGLNAFKLLGAQVRDRNAARRKARSGRARRWSAPAKAITAAPWRARPATPAARRASTWRTTRRPSRVDAIAGEGAEVIASMAPTTMRCGSCRRRPTRTGWTIVSDTAWPGYERIPRLIMLGYTRMMDEVRDQGSGIRDPGVRSPSSSRAASADCCARWRAGARFIAANRIRAWWPSSRRRRRACRPRRARDTRWPSTGPLTTTMAGLRNREVSPPAFISLPPERRCLHGHRRWVGARGDAGAGAAAR